jgi:O-antigen/teichoic acid export membrane protein
MLVAHERNFILIVVLTTIAYVSCAVLATVAARRTLTQFHSNASGVTRRDLIEFGLRGFLGSLYPIDSFRLDTVIVGILLSPFLLGLYVVASSFTNISRFIAQAISLIALPQIAASPDFQSRRSMGIRFVVLGTIVSLMSVALLEILVGYLIPALFGESFVGSVVIARILLIGALCLAIRRVLAESLKGAGFPLGGTIAEIACWVALAPALAFTVRNGATGIAWALSLAFAFSLCVLVVVAARWSWKQVKLAQPNGR